jgi:hypothetical protein
MHVFMLPIAGVRLGKVRAQIRDEGRYLGGRPLYGYRLVDAGTGTVHKPDGPAARGRATRGYLLIAVDLGAPR